MVSQPRTVGSSVLSVAARSARGLLTSNPCQSRRRFCSTTAIIVDPGLTLHHQLHGSRRILFLKPRIGAQRFNAQAVALRQRLSTQRFEQIQSASSGLALVERKRSRTRVHKATSSPLAGRATPPKAFRPVRYRRHPAIARRRAASGGRVRYRVHCWRERYRHQQLRRVVQRRPVIAAWASPPPPRPPNAGCFAAGQRQHRDQQHGSACQ